MARPSRVSGPRWAGSATAGACKSRGLSLFVIFGDALSIELLLWWRKKTGRAGGPPYRVRGFRLSPDYCEPQVKTPAVVCVVGQSMTQPHWSNWLSMLKSALFRSLAVQPDAVVLLPFASISLAAWSTRLTVRPCTQVG